MKRAVVVIAWVMVSSLLLIRSETLELEDGFSFKEINWLGVFGTCIVIGSAINLTLDYIDKGND